MLELDALAMLRTFGESRYSPSIRNCVKTMGMLATSIYTIDNSQAWFCFLMVKLLSHWLLSPERYHRELCGFKSFYLGQKLDKHACLHMPPHASTCLHMPPHDSIVYWIETGCSLKAHSLHRSSSSQSRSSGTCAGHVETTQQDWKGRNIAICYYNYIVSTCCNIIKTISRQLVWDNLDAL